MAAIYLIRHGQASFGKADYDQLSDIGCKQSEMLGKYWQSISTPDKIYSGDLLRHGQTLEHFLQGHQSKPSSVTVHSGFNEFNHVDILTCYDSEWKNFAAMAASISQQPNAHKVFQQTFALALKRWISGQHNSDYKESWSQFKKRCVSALQAVIKQELTAKKIEDNDLYSKDIYIFTSGGTIAVTLQHILGLSDQKTLEINQQIRNTSVTKLLFSEHNLNIDYFNNYSHLTSAGADWVTFR